MITQERMTLTPEIAKQFMLKNDPRQRRIKWSWVTQLARNIKLGYWDNDLSLEPIDFNEKGFMQNGQHRCLAVINADKPIKVTVRYGCPCEWFELYDRNKPRTVKDFYRGKNYNTVIPLSAFAICINGGSTLNNAIRGRFSNIHGKEYTEEKPSNEEQLDYIYKNEEDLAYFAQLAVKTANALNGGSKAIFAEGLYLLWHLGEDRNALSEMVDDICRDVPNNVDILRIKNWYNKVVLECAKSRSTPPKETYLSMILLCYEAYTNKTEIKKQVNKSAEKVYQKYCGIVKGKVN